MLNELQISNNFAVSVIFWAVACAIQYDLTIISWSPINTLVHRWHCAHQLVLYSKHHAPELHTAAVLLVQPYQLSGTIFQLQSLKQTVCLHSVVDSRHICLLLLLKTVVNCNVASASVSLHTFSFMALCKFVFNFNFNIIVVNGQIATSAFHKIM